jgi:mono/diheme cytochrome c family protein
MKIVVTVLVVLVVLVLGVLAVAYGGFVDVAATSAGSAPVEWFLHTTRESAIHSAIDDVEVPPLDDPAKLRTGLAHYHQMCVLCHGAPGIEAGELAQGLNPVPPELYHEPAGEITEEAGEEASEEAAEVFWVVKNGIRMTGMPAFGPTHSDEDVWAIAAFVQRLPELSAEEYATMVRNAGLSMESAGGHAHGGEAGHHREESAYGGGSAAGQPEADEPAGEGADGHTHAPGEGHG